MSIEKDLEKEIEQMEARIGRKPVDSDSQSESAAPTEPEFSKSETVDQSNQTDTQARVAPKPEVTEEKNNQDHDWEKRFKNYKTSTDASLFKKNQEIVALTESNKSLATTVEELKQRLSEVSNPSEDIYKDLFSEEEKDLVGDDTISTMKKATNAAVSAAVKPLQEALEQERRLRLEEQSRRAAIVAEENSLSFKANLEKLAPNWASVDTNPDFHKFMSEPDPVTGIQRSQLFYIARDSGDFARVASFFNEFSDGVSAESKELDSNIAPSKSGNSAPQKQKQEVKITREFIDKFYEDCIRGKYNGKEKLRQEIEAKIDLAVAGL